MSLSFSVDKMCIALETDLQKEEKRKEKKMQKCVKDRNRMANKTNLK